MEATARCGPVVIMDQRVNGCGEAKAAGVGMKPRAQRPARALLQAGIGLEDDSFRSRPSGEVRGAEKEPDRIALRIARKQDEVRDQHRDEWQIHAQKHLAADRGVEGVVGENLQDSS